MLSKYLIGLVVLVFIIGCEKDYKADVTASNGKDGVAGVNGAKGDKGDTGLTGATGAKGATGLTGIQGTQGVAGPKGATGPQGIPGKDGKSITKFLVKPATPSECANGGTALYIFTDTNENGTYEACDTDLKVVPICNAKCNCKKDYEDHDDDGKCDKDDDDKYNDEERCEYYKKNKHSKYYHYCGGR